jgi:S1-C subfamily serine protease
LSYGIVSGLARRIEGSDGSLRNMVQITAPINPGDAGGAVLDLRGRLVGLVHSTYGRAPSIESLRSMLAEGRQWIGWGIPESQMSAEGINFAMPMNDVKPIADELIKAGAVTRGWIGIRVGNAYDEAHAVKGALVVDVVPDAPAARAGIQADDIIMAVNGEAVKDVDKLVDLIARTEAGKNLQVTVSRDGRELTVPVTVAKQPPTQEAYRSLLKEVSPLLGHGTHLGVLVQDLTPEMTDYLKAPAGALVVNVLHGSAAARSGIRSQDVITAMDGAPINSAVDLRKAVSRHKSGDKIMLEVYRDGARTSVEIALTQR